MKHAIEIDEQTIHETEERLQGLLVENRGLKELLKIKSKYDRYEPNNNNTKLEIANKEIQTDQSPTDFLATTNKTKQMDVSVELESEQVTSNDQVEVNLIDQSNLSSEDTCQIKKFVDEKIETPIEVSTGLTEFETTNVIEDQNSSLIEKNEPGKKYVLLENF